MREANSLRARLAANDLIRELGIVDPEDIDVEGIAAHCGAYVRDGIVRNAEGRIVRDGDRAVIRVGSHVRMLERRRFVIAHEIGHWVLHRDDLGLETFSEADEIYHTRSPYEIEANVFAAELLLPRTILLPILKSNSLLTRPGMETVMTVAERFKASRSATAIRLIEEASAYCAFVVSEHLKIKWCATSSAFPFFIRLESDVPVDSSVRRCRPGETTAFEEIRPGGWCVLQRAGEFTIEEQSYRPPAAASQIVMTILHVSERDDEDDN